ncbi:MAG: hypothetical protein IJA62_04595 [Ruminococcus sp.]|nr:hypothetical protein [Ruminococcus sp.]
MPHYKIADIVCRFNPRYEETAHWYKPYETDAPLDFEREIRATDEKIEYFVREGEDITPPLAENMILGALFNIVLLQFNGSYIHSSALLYDDKVYLFSGSSGVGKSTHTKKWCRLFPDRAQVINDDKPSFRIIDDKCIVYGTPFAGGTDIHVNRSAELGAIIFLEQSEENSIELLPPAKAIRYLLEQTPNKRTEKMGERMLSLYSEILTRYPVYKLRCTDSDDAVYEAMKILE